MANRFLTALLLFAVPVPLARAIPVNTVNVADLTMGSDLIVLGRVVSIVRDGTTTLDVSGSSVPAERFLASIVANYVVKGTAQSSPLPVGFAVTTAGSSDAHSRFSVHSFSLDL